MIRKNTTNPRAPRIVSAILSVILLAIARLPTRAQDKPIQTVDETCTAFAYAPDGRIAYAVRHVYSFRRLEIQRDNIWVLGTDGKRKRIVNGETLVQGNQAYSYTVRALRWSPDGTRLTADLLTTVFTNARGDTQDTELTLMLDQNGKEIKMTKGDSVIEGAYDAAWLADNATVVYLSEAAKPHLLFSIGVTKPAIGRGGVSMYDHKFSAVAWNAKQNSAVAIERNSSLSGPPRLVLVDLANETVRPLATLDGYVGGLVLSPSGSRVAYYLDQELLEVRELAHPELAARARVAFGTLQWAPDERRLLLKRGMERKASADLVWVTVPQVGAAASSGTVPVAEIQPALHGLTFRDFQLSPDGQQIAVIEPGKRNLLIYPAQ